MAANWEDLKVVELRMRVNELVLVSEDQVSLAL